MGRPYRLVGRGSIPFLKNEATADKERHHLAVIQSQLIFLLKISHHGVLIIPCQTEAILHISHLKVLIGLSANNYGALLLSITETLLWWQDFKTLSEFVVLFSL